NGATLYASWFGHYTTAFIFEMLASNRVHFSSNSVGLHQYSEILRHSNIYAIPSYTPINASTSSVVYTCPLLRVPVTTIHSAPSLMRCLAVFTWMRRKSVRPGRVIPKSNTSGVVGSIT